MQRIVSGLLAMVLFFASAQMAAMAGTDTVDYKPGVIKAAIAKGEAVLIHYKSTW